MEAFLAAFWPNLAATAAGVILGLPVALWVNRLAQSGVNREARAAQAQRVCHALEVLAAAMQSNQSLLKDYADVLAGSKARWTLPLDTSAWDATKDDLLAEMTDPALRRELAFHFLQLKTLRNLNSELLSFSVGTNASMSSAKETRAGLNATMCSMCATLEEQAKQLIAQSIESQKGTRRANGLPANA
jgi:hypothetical protein